jgi:hypothetical protein
MEGLVGKFENRLVWRRWDRKHKALQPSFIDNGINEHTAIMLGVCAENLGYQVTDLGALGPSLYNSAVGWEISSEDAEDVLY